MSSSLRPRLIASGLALCMAQAVLAAGPAQRSAPAKWHELTVEHQIALAPLVLAWPTLDPSQREKWVDVAQRLPSMSLEDQSRLRERMREWNAMSPADRGRARLQFQETRQLPARSRAELWQAYQALPESERIALAQRAAPVGVTASTPKPANALDGSKRNLVAPVQAAPQSLSPTVVRAGAGISTKLVNRTPTPPAHHQPGLPKIAATPAFVDPNTLLPLRGPQGAAARSAADPKAAATETAPEASPATPAEAPAPPSS
jgi:hypothetical protein